MKHILALFIALTFCVLARPELSLASHGTPADTIRVSTLADNSVANGDCTLREALEAANTDTPVDECMSGNEADVIDLRGLSGTLYLSDERLDITEPVDLLGPGADQFTISGRIKSTTAFVPDEPYPRLLGLSLTGQGLENFRGKMDVISCVIFDVEGTGIENEGGLTLINSTVTGNANPTGAGGIFNLLGSVHLIQSTVSNNEGRMGGGILNNGILELYNSTVSGNRATRGGAGIFSESYSGWVFAYNSTIAFNTGVGDAGLDIDFGYVQLYSTLIVGNSIDLIGTPQSLGYNVIGTMSNSRFEPTATDQVIEDEEPGVFPLADNGGETWTNALTVESPALDAGSCAESGIHAAYDQRGFSSLQAPNLRAVDLPTISNIGDGCDVGAFELSAVSTAEEEQFKRTEVEQPQRSRLFQSLYPNPARHAVTLEIRALASAPVMIDITDVAGRIVFERELGTLPGQSAARRSISLPRLPDGIYFVRMSTGSQVDVRPLVILH